MGLFKRHTDEWVDPSAVSPEEATRRAREGLAKTSTYVDSRGRMRKLSPEQRAQMERAFDNMEAAQAKAAEPQPPQSDESLDRLERLAALHASGALTDEEFAAQKAVLEV